MSRKTAVIKITDDGRDFSKRFLLTEMPPTKSEKWATRAFLALARGGVEIPEDISDSGLAGVAMVGLKMFGNMRFEDAEPLLDEMMACVQVMPDPNKDNVLTPIMDGSIEEVSTLLTLRKEVFRLHVDFSKLAALFASAKAAASTPVASLST